MDSSDDEEFKLDAATLWLYIDEKISQLNNVIQQEKRANEDKINALERQISELYSLLAERGMIPSIKIAKTSPLVTLDSETGGKEAMKIINAFIKSPERIRVLFCDGFEGLRLFGNLSKAIDSNAIDGIELKYQDDKIIMSKKIG